MTYILLHTISSIYKSKTLFYLHYILLITYRTKEGYWQKLLSFFQSQCVNLDDNNNARQLLYCLTVFFLQCLHDYNMSLAPEPCPGQPQTSYFLIEAFVDPNLPNPIIEPKAKRRKLDHDTCAPNITVEKSELRSITNNFLMTVKCWDLLNSAEALQRGNWLISLKPVTIV